jgi:hypothetical protein
MRALNGCAHEMEWTRPALGARRGDRWRRIRAEGAVGRPPEGQAGGAIERCGTKPAGRSWRGPGRGGAPERRGSSDPVSAWAEWGRRLERAPPPDPRLPFPPPSDASTTSRAAWPGKTMGSVSAPVSVKNARTSRCGSGRGGATWARSAMPPVAIARATATPAHQRRVPGREEATRDRGSSPGMGSRRRAAAEGDPGRIR